MENEETTQDDAQQDEQVQDNDTTNESDNEAESSDDVADEGDDQDAEAGATADVDTAANDDTAGQDAQGEAEDEDDEIANFQPQRIEVAPIDFSKLPTDADGNIEPQALAQAMAEHDQQLLAAAGAQARNENMQMQQEASLWRKAEQAYPQITKDKDIRRLVQDTRYGIIASGKNATPLQAAQRIFKHIGQAARNGAKQATENTRIQRSAALETSSTRASVNPREALMKRVTSGNRTDAADARRALLESYIADGSIKTRT